MVYTSRSSVLRGKRGRAGGVALPPTQTFSAGNSTVTATSPITNDGVQTSTVTVTVKDTNGNPISGYTVVIASTGSNNTLGQPGASSDANGVCTGTLKSTTAETKTVSATANSNSITQTASVVVNSGGGVTPLLLEDFSTYSSTANMIADPRGIYSTAEDVNTADMVLDTSVGYSAAGLTQSMRYDWPDRTGEGGSGTTGRCGDDTIGRNLSLPSHQTKIWVELIHKTQSTFKTLAPSAWACTSAAAYKTLFGRLDVSRYNLVLGIFGETADYTFSAGPGNQEPADYALTWNWVDGNWHIYHMKFDLGTGSNGVCNLGVDNVNVKTNTGLSQGGASYIYGIALGRNMNQGPGATQSEWWGRCTVYNTDPGWTDV